MGKWATNTLFLHLVKSSRSPGLSRFHLLNCPKGWFLLSVLGSASQACSDPRIKALVKPQAFRTQETPSLYLLGEWLRCWLRSRDDWSSPCALWLSSKRQLQHNQLLFAKTLEITVGASIKSSQRGRSGQCASGYQNIFCIL